MALPKFGTSGRPVFASSGRPAFSCATVTQNCPPCTGLLSLSTSFMLRLQNFTHIPNCYALNTGVPGFNRVFISGVVVNDLDMLAVAQPTLQCVHSSLTPVPTTGTVRVYASGDTSCPAPTPDTQVTNLRLTTTIFRPVLTGGFNIGVNLIGDITHFGSTIVDQPLAVVVPFGVFITPSTWNCLGVNNFPGGSTVQGFSGGTVRVTRFTL